MDDMIVDETDSFAIRNDQVFDNIRVQVEDECAFFKNNFVSKHNLKVEVDPCEFLFEPDEDLLQQISEDLEIPMVLDNEDNPTIFLENNLQMNITETIRNIKHEQHTPEPSSDSSVDGWTLHNDMPVELHLLETPPITPQSSLDGSPPATPTNHDVSYAVQGLLQNIPSMTSIPILNGVETTKRPKNILPALDQSKNGSESQILVLTPEEYAKFTSMDIQRKMTDCTNPVIKTHCSATKTSQLSSLKRLVSLPTQVEVKQELDMNLFKRQQRMIKNRESACLSRKKKKEYMANLEIHIRDLATTNNQLQQENFELKQLINKLEEENTNLKKQFQLKGIKKATAILAVIFMFALNLSPLSNLYTNQNQLQPSNDATIHHHSRALLWSQNNDTDWLNDNQTNIPTSDDTQFVSQSLNTSNILSKTNCSNYFNKTESQRLDSELRGWVFREKEKFDKHHLMFGNKKLVPPIPKLRSLIVKEYIETTDYRETSNYNNELQIYNLAGESHHYFLEAIDRRDDTFYVVSFPGDHLLVPALKQNKTTRPLMSLLLPATSLNDTNDRDKQVVTMMQIDCEVTNTKLVQIKESLIRPLKQGVHNETLFNSPYKERKLKKKKNKKKTF